MPAVLPVVALEDEGPVSSRFFSVRDCTHDYSQPEGALPD